MSSWCIVQGEIDDALKADENEVVMVVMMMILSKSDRYEWVQRGAGGEYSKGSSGKKAEDGRVSQ